MKRSILISGSVMALTLLLAGAAFMSARLLTMQELTPDAEFDAVPGSGNPEGEVPVAEIQLILSKADELPDISSDVSGLFVRREDDSLFIGTGNLNYTAFQKPDGGLQRNISHDGPVVEVVVTHDTVAYRDATAMSFGETVQQVVEPGSVDEICAQTVVSAWGDRRGDRVVARVLLYELPPGWGGQ